jgi:hypothetical protein
MPEPEAEPEPSPEPIPTDPADPAIPPLEPVEPPTPQPELPEPEPTNPLPVTPSDPEPTQEPQQPAPLPTPEPQSNSNLPLDDSSQLLTSILADGNVSAQEVESIIASVSEDGKLSEAEKEIVAEAIVAQYEGEPVPAAALVEAGIDYEDLPPETPVETRVDESGEPIIITAEVADALELVSDPSELVGAIFTDPTKALLALASIGADMSDTERQESQTVVVASVIIGAIASLSIRRM